MKVLKFGGSSLANGEGLRNCLEIIASKAKENIAVVVSARGKSTDELEALLNRAATGKPFTEKLDAFFDYQEKELNGIGFTEEKESLGELLNAVRLTGEFSTALKDRVISLGELISARTIVALLKQKGLEARFVDSRQIIKTDINGSFRVLEEESEKLVVEFFKTISGDEIPVITGFIASDLKGNTTTLGRNGSNYTATLIASYLGAEEVQNWTNIDGIYTANPAMVADAQKIELLTYREANELANFGANILHAKTILPLIEKQIPIRILNTFKPEVGGTTINGQGAGKGIKAVSIIQDVSLISIEGRGLMGKIGIDARIFTSLSQSNISVRMISQASSERGIGFIVNQPDAGAARAILEQEFIHELEINDISGITVNNDLAIIAIIGRHNYALEKAISGLRKNRIWMYLINNSISGEHISLVVSNNDLKKAVNVVHNQVFGAVKRLNIVALGKGTVGGTFIDQVIGTREEIIKVRKLKLSVVGVTDSRKFLFNPKGVGRNWRTKLAASSLSSETDVVLEVLADSGLENLVLVDNTASHDIVASYPGFVEQGFDLIASNKVANSIDYGFYQQLRKDLARRGRSFLYETNVGAGLPLIDTLKLLHQSGEQINRIRGVFSGSLSYIFNNFSERKKTFSEVLLEAREMGLTEPDPREDLSGNDVARKLLILAREIGMENESTDVNVQNLIPEALQGIASWEEFSTQLDKLDTYYTERLAKLSDEKVFRYVGELDKDGELKVSLAEVDRQTPLGNISGSDSIFEIYTEAYGDNPVVIQGAGAGAEVTARGVYSDLLRIGSKL
jgi:aspartate kinase